MNPVAVAAKGKGAGSLVRRARAITARYGVSPDRMERCLATVLSITERHGCSATLPVTAATVARNPGVIRRYAAFGIEFAVHGYHHIDHIQLSAADQIDQLGRGRRLLQANGIAAAGFRAPYLRWNEGTLHALRENGFLYDSSQAFHWSIDGGLETDAYRRGLDFYSSIPADEHPVLPWLDDGLVRIPVSLPDDESVIDRLPLPSPEAIANLWLDVQRRTHERGELFTMQVHPERIEPCAAGIEAVLRTARSSTPGVWIAPLGDIARWWRERAVAEATVVDGTEGRIGIEVAGPDGLTVLARGLDVDGSIPWGDGYVRIPRRAFAARADRLPLVGVHPASPGSMVSFLRQQGYLVELSETPERYPCFLERRSFSRPDELPLLTELEAGTFPLVRLGRWPDGARSAVALTGDVDALTVWDYGLRFLGR